MTREVIWIEPGDDLALAWGLMSRLAIRHLPVVENGKLVGILSDRDVLVLAGVTNGLLDVPALPVSEAMTRSVITCGPTASISSIGARMLNSKIDCLPIVTEDGALVGLVTSSDLIQVLIDREDALSLPLPFEFTLQRGPPSPSAA
jgi:acetoin utilization protein AcuB